MSRFFGMTSRLIFLLIIYKSTCIQTLASISYMDTWEVQIHIEEWKILIKIQPACFANDHVILRDKKFLSCYKNSILSCRMKYTQFNCFGFLGELFEIIA